MISSCTMHTNEYIGLLQYSKNTSLVFRYLDEYKIIKGPFNLSLLSDHEIS